jgi:hypothetical protein
MLYTKYSPLVQPSLLVMSLTKDPPHLVYLSPPLPSHHKLSHTAQYLNHVRLPVHVCSSVTHGTLIIISVLIQCNISCHYYHLTVNGIIMDNDKTSHSCICDVHSEVKWFLFALCIQQLHLQVTSGINMWHNVTQRQICRGRCPYTTQKLTTLGQ